MSTPQKSVNKQDGLCWALAKNNGAGGAEKGEEEGGDEAWFEVYPPGGLTPNLVN